ncbi:enoyl-CoA hydratase/isomerase family protein [Ignavigranum ruoffiae]|uniref:enoyl-CoA hydratase/isomerase family protein n=1 Tax=Ignavigranum ruoffiae TaxID=89093 RepID=UPI0024ACF06D|nr:enoyl-CoA hydratase/isomerase family protein [Ignavigranum ruoffiae]
MTDSVVLYEEKNQIAYITINRPKALNAINHDVIAGLEQAFKQASDDDSVKGIVIQGSGEKAFVAGADLKFFVENVKAKTVDKIVDFTRQGHELLRALETSSKPTIAVVDGLSLGGGSELALACQYIIATDKGSFGFPESGLGIYPGYGGLLRTNKFVGPELTKYYGLTGENISAADASEMGIVDALVPADEVEKTIEKLVAQGVPVDKYQAHPLADKYQEMVTAFKAENIEQTLAGQAVEGVSPEFATKVAKKVGYKSPNSVKVIQELVDAQTPASIDEGIQIELGQLSSMFGNPEAEEGLNAVIEGRRPDFSAFK